MSVSILRGWGLVAGGWLPAASGSTSVLFFHAPFCVDFANLQPPAPSPQFLEMR
jgi:hypothetical protein